MKISNCNSRVKSINHVIGRCALFNVKLHFFYQFVMQKMNQASTNWLWTAMITDDKTVLHILNGTHTT